MGRFIESLSLNSAQTEAVLHNEGSQLVFAGAGTGKTRVLTAKIAWLIREQGVRPHSIFAATFTNKAAREMRERVEDLIGQSCKGMWIGTFHSLCVRILREEAEKIGYSRRFVIYDSNDQISLIKRIMKDNLVDEKALSPRSVLSTISGYKNRSQTVDMVESTAKAYYEKEIAHLYRSYQEGLKAADAMDFDDLILNVVLLFQNDPSLALYYQERFRYILVDEYQDTNGAQFLLIKSLAGAINPVFAVGDDDQSIYGWRGAQIQNIRSFHTTFPDTTVFKLEQNYRSTPQILEFANSLIKHNERITEKSLWSKVDSGAEVCIRAFTDDSSEASSIAKEISEEVSGGHPPGQISILFRTNAQSRLFEESLRREKVPYILVGGTSFYSRKEIKDVLAYLRVLVNPRDDINCQRILNVPARGVGAVSQERIAAGAREAGCGFLQYILSGEAESVVRGKAQKGLASFRHLFEEVGHLFEDGLSPAALVEEILSGSGYIDDLTQSNEEGAKERLDNISEFINAVSTWEKANGGGDIAQFLEEITLQSDVDNWDKGEAVNLMTLHASKGLEFDRVYVVGVEDGLLPSQQNIDDRSLLEEECRLLYVGVTRAQKVLTVSHTESRMRFGTYMPMRPSRFLDSIPESLYRFMDDTALYSTVEWDDGYSQLPPSKPKAALRKGSSFGGAQRVAPRKPVAPPVYEDFSQVVEEYRVGQRVSHAKFGSGKIMNLSGFGPDLRVTVLFEGGVRKQLIAKFAKLTIE